MISLLYKYPEIVPDEPSSFDEPIVVFFTEQLMISPLLYPAIPPVYKQSSFDIVLLVIWQLEIVP